MPRARVEMVRRAVLGATTLAAALVSATAVPVASAGAADDHARGVGLEYAYPVRYIQISGYNQNGQPTQTPVEAVGQFSITPHYQTLYLVSPSELAYGASPPASSPAPERWRQGTLHIQTWSSYTSANENVSSGDTVCPAPSSPHGDWRAACVFIIPFVPSPPPPTQPPLPPATSTPAPPSPSPSLMHLTLSPTSSPTAAVVAHGSPSAASRAVKREYADVLLAEFFGPARAVCSQLTAAGIRAYTRGGSNCTGIFATDQRALKLKLAGTSWPALITSVVAHLKVKVRDDRATAIDPSGAFRQTKLIKVAGRWKFSSAPPLPGTDTPGVL